MMVGTLDRLARAVGHGADVVGTGGGCEAVVVRTSSDVYVCTEDEAEFPAVRFVVGIYEPEAWEASSEAWLYVTDMAEADAVAMIREAVAS